jgi:hypothetical protein
MKSITPGSCCRFIPHPSSLILFAALALAGCSDAGDRLVVATWWPREDRARVESAFRKWLADSVPSNASRPTEIEWRLVGGWDDWHRELERPHPPDVLLGGRIASLARLAGEGRLTAAGNAPATPYLVLGAGEIRLADRTGQPASRSKTPRAAPGKGGAGASWPGGARSVTFDDPRSDPVSRTWAASLLDSEQFNDGFTQLVRSAGSPRRIGRRAGAARGAVERGEASMSPLWIAQRTGFEIEDSQRSIGDAGSIDRLPEAAVLPRFVEGAAVVVGCRNPELAGQFLRFLAETRGGGPTSESSAASPQSDPDVDELIADLVGAVLVDAQDELWAAWAAVDRARDPEPARKWMTEPPPWPPASIAGLLARGDSDALNLVETLAREIAPEAAVRAELMRTWLAPARSIDRTVLAELAHLAGGRLTTEPRFRAWLSAEWTVWARKRFRRVARLALAPAGKPSATGALKR